PNTSRDRRATRSCDVANHAGVRVGDERGGDTGGHGGIEQRVGAEGDSWGAERLVSSRRAVDVHARLARWAAMNREVGRRVDAQPAAMQYNARGEHERLTRIVDRQVPQRVAVDAEARGEPLGAAKNGRRGRTAAPRPKARPRGPP